VLVYLLAISGIVAVSASNVLATAVSWAWIDFLCLLAVLFLNRTVEIDAHGVSPSIHNSLSFFAINMLGTILMVLPALQSSHASLMDWSLVWNKNPTDLSLFIFLAGVTLRLVIAPLQFTYSRLKTGSTGAEILLRILPAVAVLSLLAKAWPPQLGLLSGAMLSLWSYLFFMLVALMAGLQWWISSSSYERRELFCLLVPIFALLAAFLSPGMDHLFLAAGGTLILGTGIVFLYSGFLPHRGWLAAFLLVWAVLFSGFPFSPMSQWIVHIYSNFTSPVSLAAALPLLIVHILILSSVLRLTFESAEEFPSNEPIFLFLYSLGMSVSLAVIIFPGWGAPVTFFSAVFPVVLLATGVAFWYISRRIQRINASLSGFLETLFRLHWLQNALVVIFGQLSNGISALESFLSGEGVMLWSLGIALLLLLAFRGG
jgi:hypothetical protein